MRRRTINLVSVLFFLIVASFYLLHERYFPSKKHEIGKFVPVIEVHDGDTVSVIINKRQEKVRLIGIDAPEIGQKPWGKNAKEHLETLLSSSGGKVTMEFDVDKWDKYGRMLAYLWTPKREMINLLMIRDGYAMLFTFPPDVKHADELKAAQMEARDRGLGIWAENGLKEKPVDYRREHPRM